MSYYLSDNQIKDIVKTIPPDKLRLPEVVHAINIRLQENISTCSRCGLKWSACKTRGVHHPKNRSSATFAVCTYCWDQSTIEELIRYHEGVYYSQQVSLQGHHEPAYTFEQYKQEIIDAKNGVVKKKWYEL